MQGWQELSRKYYVTYEETCPECNGSKYVTNPEWLEFSNWKREWEKENTPPHELPGYPEYNHREKEWLAEAAYWEGLIF